MLDEAGQTYPCIPADLTIVFMWLCKLEKKMFEFDMKICWVLWYYLRTISRLSLSRMNPKLLQDT